MLCKIKFVSDKKISLPFGYQYYFQSMLYNWINEKSFADFLHNTGYSIDKRSYKLFSFSNVIERPLKINRHRKEFVFPKEINFYVCSINNKFFNHIFNSIISQSEVRLGKNTVFIENIEFIPQIIGEREVIKTLAPVTVYSTLYGFDGKKKTYYYSPREKEFNDLIRKNLIHKYQALNGELPENDEFCIIQKGNTVERVIQYKGFIIKGYMGIFEIKGAKELMDLAFATGLGAKNSQGFGMIIKKE
ncbi:CRISPR-associated endoribonuclease Cas6 [Defluviitalea phaphyphila]|uniref:CRISPR-associated endoribonuclease Cas6 n=1 Tax=Defluviitalea phaphyphila TaxID=1473580 RepID=UPI000730AAF3|nr:CRISPR-associated endoribonuclease Cas6 [Defluviitalea phaphyphila]